MVNIYNFNTSAMISLLKSLPSDVLAKIADNMHDTIHDWLFCVRLDTKLCILDRLNNIDVVRPDPYQQRMGYDVKSMFCAKYKYSGVFRDKCLRLLGRSLTIWVFMKCPLETWYDGNCQFQEPELVYELIRVFHPILWENANRAFETYLMHMAMKN